MTAVLPGRRSLAAMSEEQLSEAFGAGDITAAQVERECARRENAARAKARRRFQHTDWHGAAFGNYAAAEAYCHGDHHMLSEAGRRTGRSPWPMLWQGSEEQARRLASEEVQRFWDHVSPRPPGPAAFAAAMRAPEPAPLSALELAEQAAMAHKPAGQAAGGVPPARPPGSIARAITALSALERQVTRTARSLERVR